MFEVGEADDETVLFDYPEGRQVDVFDIRVVMHVLPARLQPVCEGLSRFVGVDQETTDGFVVAGVAIAANLRTHEKIVAAGRGGNPGHRTLFEGLDETVGCEGLRPGGRSGLATP